jgi:hypothetical protein
MLILEIAAALWIADFVVSGIERRLRDGGWLESCD